MRGARWVLAAVMIVWSGYAPAMAADLPPRLAPLPSAPVLPQPEPFGGLYVRADGGVGFTQSPSLSISPNPLGRPAASPADPAYRGTYTASRFTRSRLGTGAFGDFGVGYQVSSLFRVDVTGEYRGGMGLSALGQLTDRGTTSTPFGTLPVRNTATTSFSGQLSSAIFLANAYVDLGNYKGLTPFVGAGVGTARNFTSGMKESGTFSVRIANAAPLSAPFRGVLGNGGQTSLAWALMGGVAYDITPGLKLEVGYRYLDFGRLRTGTETLFLPNGTVLPQPYAGRGRDLVSSDAKVGLRWSFGATPVAASLAPLVSRY